MLITAILQFKGVKGWVCHEDEYDALVFDDPALKPTPEELKAWEVEFDAFLKSMEYKDLRKTEMPPIEEQLDMLFHDMENGSTEWRDKIRAVKAKYPKPVK